ncbi:MAG: DUF4870 domain-containing protein [Acidimicrobiales bacterium]
MSITLGVMFLIMFASAVANLVFPIIGAVRASRQEWWRSPVTIRFVKS